MEYGKFNVSIDKIKLKGKIQVTRHKWIPHKTHINAWAYYALPDDMELVSESESLSPFKYRYSHCIRVKGESEGVFYIAHHYNGDFRDSKQRPNSFIIEYNPNKSGKLVYKAFCESFIFDIDSIPSFDIAYDIQEYTCNDVLLDTKCDIMKYGTLSNQTLYVSPKSENSGRIKVYNKHLERALQGEKITPLLRIEATVKCPSLEFNKLYLNGKLYEEIARVVEHLNSVKIKNKSSDCDDWKVYALGCLTPEQLSKCLSLMSKNIRAKYKSILVEDDYFNLNLDVLTFLQQIGNLLQEWTERCKIK